MMDRAGTAEMNRAILSTRTLREQDKQVLQAEKLRKIRPLRLRILLFLSGV